MRNVMFYVEKAIERSGVKSERRLCEMLDMSYNTITAYKKGVLPTDETMMKLAIIAGIDPYIALLDLNTWRTEGETQNAYKKILEKITAATFAIFMTISVTSPALTVEQPTNPKSVSVYYDK